MHCAKWLRNSRSKRLISQCCEVVFQLAVFGFQRDGKLQGEIHSTVQKGCEIISQQKGDFAALCKILPSVWSDLLAMAVTLSFQLRIVHRLKHWIVNFLSFEKNIECMNWTSGSAPKVADMTVIKNMLHDRFLFASPPCIPDFAYGKGLQSFGSSCF